MASAAVAPSPSAAMVVSKRSRLNAPVPSARSQSPSIREHHQRGPTREEDQGVVSSTMCDDRTIPVRNTQIPTTFSPVSQISQQLSAVSMAMAPLASSSQSQSQLTPLNIAAMAAANGIDVATQKVLNQYLNLQARNKVLNVERALIQKEMKELKPQVQPFIWSLEKHCQKLDDGKLHVRMEKRYDPIDKEYLLRILYTYAVRQLHKTDKKEAKNYALATTDFILKHQPYKEVQKLERTYNKPKKPTTKRRAAEANLDLLDDDVAG